MNILRLTESNAVLRSMYSQSAEVVDSLLSSCLDSGNVVCEDAVNRGSAGHEPNLSSTPATYQEVFNPA